MFKNRNLVKSAIALSVIASSSLYATNGDSIIGVGAKTRAMGGAGIALSHGAESTLVNPALITSTKDTEISFGGTVFMPTIKTQLDPLTAGKKIESDADLSIIPALAITSQVYPNVFMGVGMYGTAGMGTDFRGNNGLFNMETTLQLMQFAVPIAYKFAGGLSVGITPIMQYGSLDINYQAPAPIGKVGYGQKQDFGFGVSLGAVYDFGNGFSVGAVYKSEIEMKYPNVISQAAGKFNLKIGDTLTQPAEIGVGVAYKNGPHSIALDYKKIKWSSAEGYKAFGWKDQDVFAIGYEYDAGKWAARVGFNHGSSPITIGKNPAINMFNLLGFPATSKNHFTAGGSYKFSKNFSMDLTVVYSPKETTSAAINMPPMPMTKITNEHSELGATVQFNYKF